MPSSLATYFNCNYNPFFASKNLTQHENTCCAALLTCWFQTQLIKQEFLTFSHSPHWSLNSFRKWRNYTGIWGSPLVCTNNNLHKSAALLHKKSFHHHWLSLRRKPIPVPWSAKGGGSVVGGGGAHVNPWGAAVVALISPIHGYGARSRAVPETPFLTLNTHTWR